MKTEKTNFDSETDPLWYKDCFIYQLNVKSYRDSNKNGIGDFKGLIQKLDYLQNLGITAIWLLPFYPSPLKDDGYDISDFYNIHSDYGTLEDFKDFLKAAHNRYIKVIIELVINHTSDQHPWFKRARISKEGSNFRNYYVWSNNQDKYKDARIIFNDFESSNWAWDPIAKAYFWHRFYSHQPDLNFDNPNVIKEIFNIVDFWFDIGVDGMRLDAVPYLFKREGTNCENLPETHNFLKSLNTHVKKKFNNKMLLAEANQWPEDAVAYFGNGDECQMAFHFPLMPRIFIAIQMEERFPIIDIMEQTPPIPDSCQWIMFLRNHDELTLEMVTDEERDYMYRFYAKDKRARINFGIRRRLAPLINNDRRKIELLNILMMSFIGTPIIYYGDEIGMGDNYYLGDRNGVRTPMQWSSDTNAGFSEANPQELFLPIIIDPEYHYEAINVSIQQRNTSSLLLWMKKAISIRKTHKAFSRGTIDFLNPSNSKILTFVRIYKNESILVVINLSKYSQAVELDLTRYSGRIPIDMFSGNKFPIIKESKYILTLSSHDYYWFVLHEQNNNKIVKKRGIPKLTINKDLCSTLNPKCKNIILDYLRSSPNWRAVFGNIQDIAFGDQLTFENSLHNQFFLLIKIIYADSHYSYLSFALALVPEEHSAEILGNLSSGIIAHIYSNEKKYLFCESIYSQKLRVNLLKMLLRSHSNKCANGIIKTILMKNIKRALTEKKNSISSNIHKDTNNFTSMLLEDSFILKLFKGVESDLNPDIEIIRTLSGKSNFKNMLPYEGEIVYQSDSLPDVSIGLIQDYIQNEGTAWHYFLNASIHHYEMILASKSNGISNTESSNKFFENNNISKNPTLFFTIQERIYFEMVTLLGQRTAEMHFALAGLKEEPNFIPEPYTSLYQRSLYQSIWSLVKNSFRSLKSIDDQQPFVTTSGRLNLNILEAKILKYIRELPKLKIKAKKIRIHGDYHLGQVLFTGKDFIVDFEGNSGIPGSERRLKRSPMLDLASMIWSFHYVAFSAMNRFKQTHTEDVVHLETIAENWWVSMCNNFYSSYIKNIKDADIFPENENTLNYLLTLFLLEKNFLDININIKNNEVNLDENINRLVYFQNEFL